MICQKLPRIYVITKKNDIFEYVIDENINLEEINAFIKKEYGDNFKEIRLCNTIGYLKRLLMKNKPSIKVYTFQANIYAAKLGSTFGVTINTNIFAENETEALERAKEHFNDYVDKLSICNNNKFEYNNLKLV